MSFWNGFEKQANKEKPKWSTKKKMLAAGIATGAVAAGALAAKKPIQQFHKRNKHRGATSKDKGVIKFIKEKLYGSSEAKPLNRHMLVQNPLNQHRDTLLSKSLNDTRDRGALHRQRFSSVLLRPTHKGKETSRANKHGKVPHKHVFDKKRTFSEIFLGNRDIVNRHAQVAVGVRWDKKPSPARVHRHAVSVAKDVTDKAQYESSPNKFEPLKDFYKNNNKGKK